MRRRDVIQALCGLLGVGTLATRRVRAAAPRQILLARLHVAGTAYYDAEAAADRLRPGQRLALRRQPENRYDALAIEVLGPDGHKLGYVPRRRNEMPARLMDAGKRLSARTESLAQRGSWLNIEGLAVPGRCLNRPVDGGARSKADPGGPMPEPERDPGLADWHGRTRRPPPARAKVQTRRRQSRRGTGSVWPPSPRWARIRTHGRARPRRARRAVDDTVPEKNP